MYMREDKKILRVWVMCLMMLIGIGVSYADDLKPAGTTSDRPTIVTEETTLSVQSGGNYIRLNSQNLPATITYISPVVFGPIPEAKIGDAVISGKAIFADCHNGWEWKINESEEMQIVEIRAHEYASVLVQPVECPGDEDTTAVAFDSFTWDRSGETYTESGNYSTIITGPYSCEHLFTLHLTIHKTTIQNETVSACESYTIAGKTYTGSREVKDTTVLTTGDRIVTIYDLTINHATKGDTTAVECSSFSWYGTEYTKSGKYTHMLTNKAGCDSTLTLDLTIHQPTKGDTTAVECGSFTWYGTEYTESGEHTHMLKNKAGCDSTLTLHLTINHATKGDTTAVECGSFSWYDTEYTKSGEHTHMLKNKAGCDSTLTLHLTILQPTKGDTTAVECGSFTWYGTEYTKSGKYTHTLTNKAGCDSTLTLDLTIHQPTTGDTAAVKCGSFTWYGTEYTQTGKYTHVFEKGNKVGCDSTVTLHLTISTPTTGDTIAKECVSFSWYGTEYTESGEYTHMLTNKAGCDSTLTLKLTILQPTKGEEVVTRCLSYTSPRGNTYTESGDYTEMTKNAAGCDSTVTIHLTLIGDCTKYDTIYFCTGANTPHDERVSEEWVRRYLPYRYEAPSQLSFLEGVVIEMRADSTLMDLGRAESNLRAYYVGELVPIERVAWSARYRGTTEYVPIIVEDHAQWVAIGQIAVQVQFLCGEVYNNSFSTEGMERIQNTEYRIQKVMINGQIYLIYNGIMYNVQGMRMSGLVDERVSGLVD